MADFNIQYKTREVPYTDGDRVRRQFYPAAGNNCAIVYIEASAGSGAAILAKLAEIEVLAEDYRKLQWQATALDATVRPAVDVRAIVMNNAPLPMP